jgi:hypothetical protein
MPTGPTPMNESTPPEGTTRRGATVRGILVRRRGRMWVLGGAQMLLVIVLAAVSRVKG